MIDPKAEPKWNRSPYKRIDLAQRRRPPPSAITLEEAELSGLIPDPAIYEFIYGFGWVLKELS